MKYPKSITIRFDPEASACANTRVVFLDDIARTFYLLWRCNHIVSSEFAARALKLAVDIRANPPQTADDFVRIFQLGRHIDGIDFSPSDVKTFCEDAIDYFTGKNQIGYEVA